MWSKKTPVVMTKISDYGRTDTTSIHYHTNDVTLLPPSLLRIKEHETPTIAERASVAQSKRVTSVKGCGRYADRVRPSECRSKPQTSPRSLSCYLIFPCEVSLFSTPLHWQLYILINLCISCTTTICCSSSTSICRLLWKEPECYRTSSCRKLRSKSRYRAPGRPDQQAHVEDSRHDRNVVIRI